MSAIRRIIEGAYLRAVEINPVSTSPKAVARYRDICLAAVKAQAKAA